MLSGAPFLEGKLNKNSDNAKISGEGGGGTGTERAFRCWDCVSETTSHELLIAKLKYF